MWFEKVVMRNWIFFSIPLVLITLSMYGGVVYFVKRESKDGRIPARFGRFQRNIVDLNNLVGCLFFGISSNTIMTIAAYIGEMKGFQRFFIILFWNLLYSYNIDSYSETTFLVYGSMAIVSTDIIGGFILPLCLLKKLRRTMPEFYMNDIPQPALPSEFFVFSQSFQPRDRKESRGLDR